MGDNPFADPSVTDITQDPSGIEEYNPFDSTAAAPQQTTGAAYAAPAYGDTGAYTTDSGTQDLLPTEGESAYGQYDDEGSAYEQPKKKKKKKKPKTNQGDATSKEEELRLREEDLAKRERELNEQVQEVREQQGLVKNWPLKRYAVTYHSIRSEIPPDYRGLMRQFYGLVLFGFICLPYNMLCVMVAWIGSSSSVGASAGFFSIICCFLGVPGSWKLWYRSLYFAIRDKKSRLWIWFFLWFGAHTVFTVFMVVGIPGTAAAGIFPMIDLFTNDKNGIGFMFVVAVAMWAVNCAASIFLFKKAHKYYKTGGAHTQLKQEAAQAAVSNMAENMTASV